MQSRAALLPALLLGWLLHLVAASSEDFQYSRGPVPDQFRLLDRYPDRSEESQCRPIRLRIERDSRRYRRDLVFNANPDIMFADSDSRLMTSRLQSRLNALSELYRREYGLSFRVLKAWTEEADPEVTDPLSLHYEGELVSRAASATAFLHARCLSLASSRKSMLDCLEARTRHDRAASALPRW